MDADQLPERQRSERVPSRIPVTLALKHLGYELQRKWSCALSAFPSCSLLPPESCV